MFMKPHCNSITSHGSPLLKGVFSTIAFFLLFLSSLVALAVNPEPSDAQKMRTTKTELELAKKGAVYTLLDLSTQQLTLKIKGLPLKKLHISEVSFAQEGTLLGSAHRLIKKHPPPPTIEKEIPPADTGDSEPQVSSLLATETVFVSVGDMPSRYRLYFEDGLMISIVPSVQECDCGRIEKGWRLIKETAANLSWEAGRSVRDHRFPDLRLILSEEEAKALFWSLSEGSWLLIESEP